MLWFCLRDVQTVQLRRVGGFNILLSELKSLGIKRIKYVSVNED